jgi:hypothetical protein
MFNLSPEKALACAALAVMVAIAAAVYAIRNR